MIDSKTTKMLYISTIRCEKAWENVNKNSPVMSFVISNIYIYANRKNYFNNFEHRRQCLSYIVFEILYINRYVMYYFHDEHIYILHGIDTKFSFVRNRLSTSKSHSNELVSVCKFFISNQIDCKFKMSSWKCAHPG